jgi:sortase A
MIVAGLLTLAWAVAVWRWEDPVTALYTAYEQRELSSGLDSRFASFASRSAPGDTRLDDDAESHRDTTRRGEAIGRLVVPRLGVDMVVVLGTDAESLKRGPGLHQRTFFPGQNNLVYIAGHRTTYAAPFSKIDSLRRGDPIRMEMPYGTFHYAVTGSRIVAATDLSVLRSKRVEQIALQACHPRFFASQRWITYGRLARVEPPGEHSAAP